MARYVGAVDQGTTSTRFMVFDKGGNEIARHQLEHQQILPQPGWVEHDPLEILARTDEVIARAMRNVNLTAADLAAIGVTNQRETTIVWNPKTGQPWYNAIVWQDTRTDRIVNALSEAQGQLIRSRTGLPPATYFSGAKIQWILDTVPGVRDAAARGDLQRIVLDPAGLGQDLLVLELVAGNLVAALVEHHEARARRPLVDRSNVTGHGCPQKPMTAKRPAPAMPPMIGPMTGIQEYSQSDEPLPAIGRIAWAMRGPRSRAGLSE